MSKKDDITKIVNDAADNIDNLPEGSRNAALALGLTTSAYIAGSLTYFAYKGVKLAIKAIENRK